MKVFLSYFIVVVSHGRQGPRVTDGYVYLLLEQIRNLRRCYVSKSDANRIMNSTKIILVAVLALSLTGTDTWAQEAQGQKNDQTGTNPINFTRDFRIYNELTNLNTEGDGTQNVTTAELRMPFANGKWQWRMRARYNSIEADINGDGSEDINESGVGDLDMRFLTVFSLDQQAGQAWAGGLEVSLDTADGAALGSGTTSLGPQLFWVKFLKNGLFAPGLQYKFSVDEDEGREEVDQILIDLNYLKMSDDKQSWFFTDPQLVFDNENDLEFAIVDFEWGWMMSKWNPDRKGQSFYIRPSIGIGGDRPTEASIEIGYKIVGW